MQDRNNQWQLLMCRHRRYCLVSVLPNKLVQKFHQLSSSSVPDGQDLSPKSTPMHSTQEQHEVASIHCQDSVCTNMHRVWQNMTTGMRLITADVAVRCPRSDRRNDILSKMLQLLISSYFASRTQSTWHTPWQPIDLISSNFEIFFDVKSGNRRSGEERKRMNGRRRSGMRNRCWDIKALSVSASTALQKKMQKNVWKPSSWKFEITSIEEKKNRTAMIALTFRCFNPLVCCC